MAEKQFARSGGNSPEFFADDDPLAELARIVGFEPKPASVPVAANVQRREPPVLSVQPVEAVRETVAERAAAQPQHPIFNLEDELLREFELYDSPRNDNPAPADDVSALDVTAAPLPEAAAANVDSDTVPDYDSAPFVADGDFATDVAPPAPRIEPVFEGRATESLDAQDEDDDFATMFGSETAVEPVAVEEPATAEEPVLAVQPDDFSFEDVTLPVEPSDDIVSGITHDVQAADDASVEQKMEMAEWPSVQHDEPPAAEAAVLSEESFDEPAVAATQSVEQSLTERRLPTEPRFSESFDGFDLADELELSLGQSPAAVEPEPVARATSQVEAESRYRLPVTNFSVQRSNYRAEPRLETLPVFHEPAIEFDRLAEEPAHDAGIADASVLDAAAAPAAQAVVAESLSLDTVEPTDEAQLDVPSISWDVATEETAVTETVVAEPRLEVEPIRMTEAASFNIDDLLADVARYPVPERKSAPIFDAPDPVAKEPVQAFATPENKDVVEASPVDRRIDRAQAAKASEPSFDDPFAGQDFDFDFDNIELDLADMNFDEPERLPVVKQEEAARKAEPLAEVVQPQQTVIRSVATPVQTMQSQYVFEQPVVARRPEPEPEVEAELPFDPTLIADSDDHPESIADMDVPSLPAVEPELKVAHPPEYDIDIDAEMANLFNPLNTVAPAKKGDAAEHPEFGNPNWARPPEPVKADAAGKSAFDEFDEFERALEEDFRRTLVEPFAEDNNAARMTIGPGGYITSEPRRRRSSRGLLVGVSLLAVICIGGAAAAYTYFFGMEGVTSTQTTGPRVIVADKEPIKIVPENRGGKTVPNQDKAVYDRVAGNTADDPKQDSLLSSKEEPVDVVQRTLVPETLPLEGGEDANAITPVGETEDARLLATDTPTANATAEADTATGVSPRKVRTMIVKSDGTLVAREASADDAVTSPVVETPVTETATTPALAVPTTTTRGAALDIPAFPAGAVTDNDATPVTSTSDAVPTTDLRGAETDNDAVTPTQPVDADDDTAAVTETATMGDQVDPPVRVVKTTKIEDKAPIPESRPVDQPVNIVGTVTDQGNVRDTTTTTETAAAEPVTKQTEVAAVAPGGYVMQIASLPSEADAKKSYGNLSQKFGGIIGGRGFDIKKAEISGKGTFYRVRIPVGSKDEAAALCVKYRAAGGTCLISK